ncbi:hypothetical protein FHS27_000446 [Rhodopirellula rubra]|uniref:Uncharacterized protein n=1 Tax=Aporhodopirellula rubra TaxID=980271 RepID=A0A7W5H2Y3_9BACT|nr:hypothetical protein [Aporhodopirellula rubra]MBB3204682.1 hypothetical protein [Aporhodopirellula rubra]
MKTKLASRAIGRQKEVPPVALAVAAADFCIGASGCRRIDTPMHQRISLGN